MRAADPGLGAKAAGQQAAVALFGAVAVMVEWVVASLVVAVVPLVYLARLT